MTGLDPTAIRERVADARQELEEIYETVGSLGTTANRLAYKRLPWALSTIEALLEEREQEDRYNPEGLFVGAFMAGCGEASANPEAGEENWLSVAEELWRRREGPPCPTE